jgi:hypothetical protein
MHAQLQLLLKSGVEPALGQNSFENNVQQWGDYEKQQFQHASETKLLCLSISSVLGILSRWSDSLRELRNLGSFSTDTFL